MSEYLGVTAMAVRLGTTYSALYRAMRAARQDPARTPPEPVGRERIGTREYPVYDVSEFAAWWEQRPRRGRPRAARLGMAKES